MNVRYGLCGNKTYKFCALQIQVLLLLLSRSQVWITIAADE